MKLQHLQEARYHQRPKTGWSNERVLKEFFFEEDSGDPEVRIFYPEENIVAYDGDDQVTQVIVYHDEDDLYYEGRNDRYGGDDNWETEPKNFEIRQTMVIYKG